MSNAANQKIADTVEKLLVDGRSFIPQMVQNCMRAPHDYQYLSRFIQWTTVCRNVFRLIGPYAAPFEMQFQQRNGIERMVEGGNRLASMEALFEAIKNDLLVPMESILRADIFSDLLEQAEHLLEEGYFLAAGVLGRAVLEEHLRKWCDRAGCAPAKAKPTLNDFNGAIYKANHITLVDMKYVESMAAIGNAAAHNLTLTKEDVERLLPDVRRFMSLHPLP